jgi:hypothetical protein
MRSDDKKDQKDQKDQKSQNNVSTGRERAGSEAENYIPPPLPQAAIDLFTERKRNQGNDTKNNSSDDTKHNTSDMKGPGRR